MLEQFLGGGKPQDGQQNSGQKPGLTPDFMKGLATGGVAGGLAGVLLGGKTSKKMAKGALKLGGTAALAGLAYKAYTQWQASKNQAPQAEAPPMKDITPRPEGTAFLPSITQQRDSMSLAILRAMISAAKADGHIDAEEQRRIFGKLDELGLDTEEKASTPLSLPPRPLNSPSRSTPPPSWRSTLMILRSRPISPCLPRG